MGDTNSSRHPKRNLAILITGTILLCSCNGAKNEKSAVDKSDADELNTIPDLNKLKGPAGDPEKQIGEIEKGQDLSTEKRSLLKPAALLLAKNRLKPLSNPKAYKPEAKTEKDKDAERRAGLAIEQLAKRSTKEALATINEAERLYPANAQVANVKGAILSSANRYKDAGLSYYKACQLDPNFYAAYVNLGAIYMKLGRYQDCLATLEYACRLGPEEPDTWTSLGAIYTELQMGKNAEASLKKALAADPGNYRALFILGYVYHCMQRYDRAETCYKQALSVRPDSKSAWLYLALVQSKLGKNEDSAESYRRLSELEEKEPIAESPVNMESFSRANALIMEGRIEEARRIFAQGITSDPKNPGNYMGLASIALGEGEPEKATKLLEKASTLSSGAIDTTEMLAQARLLSGDYKAAISGLNKAIASGKKQYSLYCLLASAYFKNKQMDRALITAQTATRLDERAPDAWLVLSNIASTEGEIDKSIDYLKKVVHQHPQYSSKVWLILIHHLVGENRLGEAGKAMEKATYLFPDSFNTYLSWGLIFRARDDLEKAEENLVKALKLDPDSAYAWNQLALVRENRGNPKGRAEALKGASSARDQSYDISIYTPDFEHYGRRRARASGEGHEIDHGHIERRDLRKMPSAVELLQED
ncbi:tetratricopeptide repeat protein [bacterium]|nr:tetratricopeptide repeat protein [bacterium]